MLLESDIEESSQVSTHHGVVVCTKIAKDQANRLFSEDCRSLQFVAINTSLWDFNYDDIHFLSLSFM